MSGLPQVFFSSARAYGGSRGWLGHAPQARHSDVIVLKLSKAAIKRAAEQCCKSVLACAIRSLGQSKEMVAYLRCLGGRVLFRARAYSVAYAGRVDKRDIIFKDLGDRVAMLLRLRLPGATPSDCHR